jgi:hypothetical protein
VLRYDFTVSHETNSLPGNKMYVVRLKKFSLQKLSLLNFTCKLCDQKVASDSSGLSGGFSGQRAWVRIIKKWAPGSYC